MKIRRLSSSQSPIRSKVMIALGAGLFSLLACPVILLAADQLTGNQETISLTAAIFKTLGSLIIVLGLMFLLLFWIRKAGLARGGAGRESLITVLDSRMLAPKKQVCLLEVAGSYLLIGLSEQQITMLATLEANDQLKNGAYSPENPSPMPASFASMLHKAGMGLAAAKKKKEAPGHAE